MRTQVAFLERSREYRAPARDAGDERGYTPTSASRGAAVSATVALSGSVAAPAATRWARWVSERCGDHAPNLLAALRVHEDGVEALRLDHGIREGVDRRRGTGDEPVSIFGWQAVAKPHAELVEEPRHIHCRILAPCPRTRLALLPLSVPVCDVRPRRRQLLWLACYGVSGSNKMKLRT